MPATRKGICTVCTHPERVRIEDLRCSSVSFGELEKRFGVSKSALHRHWHEHVSSDRKLTFLAGKGTLEELKERAAEENLTLLDSLGVVRSVLMSQVVAQGEAGNPIALAAVAGRIVDVLKEIGRLTGEIREHTAPHVSVNIGIMHSPGFSELQDGLLDICIRHPSAKADIIALIRRLDGSAPLQPSPLLLNHEPAHA